MKKNVCESVRFAHSLAHTKCLATFPLKTSGKVACILPNSKIFSNKLKCALTSRSTLTLQPPTLAVKLCWIEN